VNIKESIGYIKQCKIDNEEKVIRIHTHVNPDPDAIGSAMGIQLILKDAGLDSVVCYSGEVSHPQNKTILNVLDISMDSFIFT